MVGGVSPGHVDAVVIMRAGRDGGDVTSLDGVTAGKTRFNEVTFCRCKELPLTGVCVCV